MSLRPGQIDPLLGKTLADRFEIIERIGEGGMGVVYRARQISVDRMVAIKVLNAEVANDPTWVQRFINEARACSKLQHPNTIRLIDFGQSSKDGLLFIAMEFLDGMNLRQALERSGKMPPQRVLKIMAQACQSLAEAHAHQIIHRDLKPDNLFIINMAGSPDFVKVLDFSVAKLRQQGQAAQTQAGVVFGTPQYMSPEQGRGLPLDARSDIYSLGIVAYELLSGQAPFSSQNPMEVLAMHVRTPVPPIPGVPDRVMHVVMRSLAKDPAQRYQTVEQLLVDCQAALSDVSSPMASSSAPPIAPAAEQKTLFVPSGPGPGAPAAQPTQPSPASPASPGNAEARTMLAMPSANLQDQLAALRAQNLGGAPPAAMSSPPAAQTEVGPPPPQGGEKKTMLLDSSEGIVSFAQQAPPAAMATPVGSPFRHQVADEPIEEGASPLYWVACIVGGAGMGVLAYLVIVAVT